MQLKSSLIYCAIFFVALVRPVWSQALTDAAQLQKKINALEKIYKEAIDADPHLFNGSEYIQYSRNTEGFPFYVSESPIAGSLTYSNTKYKNVFLQYDILTDKVIIEHPTLSGSVQLVDENIQNFTLDKKSFIRIADSTKVNLSTGYYELLYAGKKLN